MSGIYYRVVAATGDVVTLQDFDERDYDPDAWLTDYNGEPLKFDSAEAAEDNHIRQVRMVSESIRMIGEAFGSLTIPAESRFLADKLVGHFNMKPRRLDE